MGLRNATGALAFEHPARIFRPEGSSGVQCRQVVRTQGEPRGGHIVVELLGGSCANDNAHNALLMEQPTKATRATETLFRSEIERIASTTANACWRSTGGKSKLLRRASLGRGAH